MQALLEPSITDFAQDDMFTALSTEFTAVAEKKNLQFQFVQCKKVVRSDQQLLRRIMQNFLSNAIRYTQEGKILLGCRRRKNMLRIEVWDTGVGIAEDKISEVFRRVSPHRQP